MDSVSRIGQGTWYIGDDPSTEESEIAALRAGIDAGSKLIDTAEMYGEGLSETLIGKAINGLYDRSSLFIVSKVYPNHSGRKKIFKSCENTLKRLQVDYIDLYLLHWRGNIPLSETVECMEELIQQKKIRHWGVSNFDVDDMEELWKVPNGCHCLVNQVLYHVGSRGIEYDLIPWLQKHNVRIMGYCPLARGGELTDLFNDQNLQQIAKKHNATVAQILIAFTLRIPNLFSIPKNASVEHSIENAKSAKIVLTEEDLKIIDSLYPPPHQKVPLDMI